MNNLIEFYDKYGYENCNGLKSAFTRKEIKKIYFIKKNGHHISLFFELIEEILKNIDSENIDNKEIMCATMERVEYVVNQLQENGLFIFTKMNKS